MSKKAFSAGVLPGGLQDRQEIKILICYIFNHFSFPLAKSDIADILQNYGLANYFETSQAFEEMVSANNIIKYDDRKYIISDTGKMIVEELSRNIPLTVREKAVKAVEEHFTRMKSEKENKVTIRKNANGYDVTCSVLDGDFEMMKLKLYAPDIVAATTIKNNFYKNPGEIYSDLLHKLTFWE